MKLKHTYIFILWIFTFLSSNAQQSSTNKTKSKATIKASQTKDTKIEALLIGVSHWANYEKKGTDVVQTNQPDILSLQYQDELKEIALKIKEFNPDKIFVERTLDYQPKLDSLYQLYKTSNWGENKRNEIYQLGFRIAKSLNHKKIYGIDYNHTQFPLDSVVKVIQQEKQMDLMGEIQGQLQQSANAYNKLVADKKPLSEILEYLNSDKVRKSNLGLYLNHMTEVGKLDNNIGSFLASEWLGRNIYMYSYILKYLEPGDKRIMILLGSGHIAAIKNMIEYNPTWKIVEVNELLNESKAVLSIKQ